MSTDSLTFTRFLAALSIVVFHYGKRVFPFNAQPVAFLFEQANVGVSYFFILSGFIMVVAYGANEHVSYFHFLKKRLARIYPACLVALMLTLGFHLASGTAINGLALFLNLALLQSWVPGYALSLNSPGWSLSVELFFYLIFPFLFNHFYKKHTISKLAAPIVVFFVTSQVSLFLLFRSPMYHGYPSKSHDFIFYFPLMHLNQFLVGNLAGLYFKKVVKGNNLDAVIIAILVIIYFILRLVNSAYLHNGLLGAAFVPLILSLSCNNGRLASLFRRRPLVFLGEISFGVYIYQHPVFAWVGWLLSQIHIAYEPVTFYVGLTVLTALSSFSFLFIETPVRRFFIKPIPEPTLDRLA